MLQNSKKDKSILIQAWIGTEAYRRLRLPTHRPPLPPKKISLVLVSVIGLIEPRATMRPEVLCQ
jgi:hypothetical protein